ncbi:class I SAM-dependent DNA methyltransferase [Micromonospora andamanensis]|uniref:HsdM family class I SAM-dependent methyltransferase n=1 Tax=Micromonospora andamanensis TaxID=1287068 RepID=UPI0019527955|nr:N-6 DNA methylase [Micromonospora andamanensis]
MTESTPGHLLSVLEELGYSGHEGLVTSASAGQAGPRDYVWRDLRSKVGLEAAFFRDGVPLVGFSAQSDPRGLTGLRRRLWNYGRIPLLVNVSEESVQAFNAVSLPSKRRTQQDGILEAGRRSDTAHGLLQAFNRAEVESGNFATEFGASYKKSARVDRALLSNLAYLRRTFGGDDTELRTAMDVIIGGCLVASYLSDREILTPNHIDELSGVPDLQAALVFGVNPTRRLFQGLADRFNGDVFGPVPEMLSLVSDSELSGVAALLRGDDLPSGQQSLWPYDFSVLPADLVSSIYEQLLEGNRETDSAYYTPRFLVDTVLDEVVPWIGQSRPKVIDLACGSGAFMTEAFRRLAYRERTRVGRDLSYQELQDILLSSIYGVELNPDSARIAAFGLYLALLEELDPPTVWETAVLPRLLGRNVVVSDAFNDHALSAMRFDAVIGNPPWKSKLTPAASRFVRDSSAPIADQQIAQAFLWLAARFLKPGGTLGLVMPSKPLLHNRSRSTQAFRTALFEQLNVQAVLDLSAIRRSLFATAIAPAAVVVARAPDESTPADLEPWQKSNQLLHIAAHPRPLNSAVDAVVISPEEVTEISRRQAAYRPDIWKVLLWGGLRDVDLLDRLRLKFAPVKEIASARGWVYGQGYQVGGGDANDASHLQGLPIIPTEMVEPLRIESDLFEAFDMQTLHRPRDRELFRSPHVLVRRTLHQGRLAAVFVEEDAVFPNGLLGFAGPRHDRPLLMALAATIVSSLGNYYHFMTSASWGVERDFVELNEHLSLPLATPDPTHVRELQDIFSQARSDPRTTGWREQLDSVVFDMYEISTADQLRVHDRLAFGLDRFQHPLAYSAPIDDDGLSQYAATIREVLAATLPDLHIEARHFRDRSYRAVTVTLTEGGAAVQDTWSNGATVDMQRIVEMNADRGATSTGVVAQPAGFFVDDDTVYVVKTADRDRWSRDAALDDAERILAALAFGE